MCFYSVTFPVSSYILYVLFLLRNSSPLFYSKLLFIIFDNEIPSIFFIDLSVCLSLYCSIPFSLTQVSFGDTGVYVSLCENLVFPMCVFVICILYFVHLVSRLMFM